MKKTLIQMELGKFYDSEYGTLVVRPAGVEPKMDETGHELTDDYPHIPITKAFRDKAELERSLNGGEIIHTTMNAGKDPSYLEFGIETIKNKTFSVMDITINQEIQRWFLNIHSIDYDSLLFTSHDIEDVLDALTNWLIDHSLSVVAVNDFIEKLTTDENLKFIKKVTLMPKNKQKDALEKGYKVLQHIENIYDLRISLVSWLGNIEFSKVGEFLYEFDSIIENEDEPDKAYKYIGENIHPKHICFSRELERMLEWYNTAYDPRCLTDEAIRCINGGLDELAKECIKKLVKEVGSEGRGGYYLHKTKENENKYIAPYITVNEDIMDFIDDCGYVMFSKNFNSALKNLGYRLDQLVGVSHRSNDNVPVKVMTFVLEDINHQKVA